MSSNRTVGSFRRRTEAEAVRDARALANETGITLAVWYTGRRSNDFCVMPDFIERVPECFRHECFVQPGDR